MWQRTAAGTEGSGYVLQDSVGCLLQGAYSVHVGTCVHENVINYLRWVHVYMLRQITDYYIITKSIIMT